MKTRIGIDMGATNLRIGKVDSEGNVLQLETALSYGQEDRDKAVNNLFELLSHFDLSDVEYIGMGVAGGVDKSKTTISSSNMAPLNDFDFTKAFKERVGLPFYIENDAKVAALAEAVYGAGRKYRYVYYITHSSGIGGALVINKKIYDGFRNGAGEVGQILCMEEPRTRVEEVASGITLLNTAKKMGYANAKELMESEDPEAKAVVTQMAKDMAMMLSTIAMIVSPDCFVFGGGVTKSWKRYYDEMKYYYDYYALKEYRDIPFVLAEITEPGVIGASLINE